MRMQTVAVVEDNPDNADVLRLNLEDVGLKPLMFSEGFDDLEELIKVVKKKADGAICDHRLSYRNYAPFEGAEAVARLYDEKIPAILVTQFRKIDADISIRLWRRKIPVLLPRSDLHPDFILSGLTSCDNEIKGHVPLQRIAHPSLVKVVAVIREPKGDVVDAIIPQWNADEAVRFPASLIQATVRALLSVGAVFLANVNIDAENSEDLFFSDFELAPDIDPNDGLA